MNNRSIHIVAALTMIIWVIPLSGAPEANRFIEKITVGEHPATIDIRLSRSGSYRVYQVDRDEVVIAFRDATVSASLVKTAYGKGFVRNVSFETLPGRVVVLGVNTNRVVQGVYPGWSEKKRTLSVRFRFAGASGKDKPAASAKKARSPLRGKKKNDTPGKPRDRKKESAPAEKVSPPAPVAASPRSFASYLDSMNREPADSVDGLMTEISNDTCVTDPVIGAALESCKNKSWREAEGTLNRYLHTQGKKTCLEPAYFLRAYCAYKNNTPFTEENGLRAVDLFQESVGFYPKSRYVPYGITALGKMLRRLKNLSEAYGHLKYVLDGYNDTAMIPEVLLEMARLQNEAGKTRATAATLERLLSRYPKSPYVSEARFELAKARYAANNFRGALQILQGLIKSDPKRIYQSPDLLEYMGKCYFQMGNAAAAGDTLFKVVNYYPDIPEKHIILSRIADIYRDQEQPKKAQKLHQYVIGHFPNTDGYIVSSVRLAAYLKQPAEREKLYRSIIADFPEHPLTQLTYLKLARAMTEQGKHEESIEIIQAFSGRNPGALKKEATIIQEEAYAAYFDDFQKTNDTAGLLTVFERDREIINRLKSPRLFLTVGKVYMGEHLYGEASRLLKQSHRLFGKQKRPPELLFDMGVSFHETGKTREALKAFDAYIRTVPSQEKRAEAHFRMGRIRMKEKSYQNALDLLKVALGENKEKDAAVDILLDLAEVHQKLGDHQAAAHRLIKAIDLLAAAPETPPEKISKAYRDLAGAYLLLDTYAKAADAFAMALKFSEKDQNTDLEYVLAETYEKDEELEKAGEVYRKIVESGDPFWARLAGERLKGIRIQTKLDSNTTDDIDKQKPL